MESTTYFFENELDATWFRTATLVPETQVHVLKTWIATETKQTMASHSSRLSTLTEFLPDSEKSKAELYLSTLESLRETFILNPEDIEYCFSQLSDTPKNKLLRNLMDQYFESNLGKDWVQSAWDFIGVLKEGKFQFQGPAHFVKSLQSSYVFTQVATSFRYACQGVEITDMIESFHLTINDTMNSTQGYGGTLPERIEMISELAKQLVHSKKRVLIPFSGEDSLRRTLAVALRSRGIKVFDLHPESEMLDYLSRLRRIALPLKERLQLVQKALQLEGNDRATWDVFLKALVKSGKISEEVAETILREANEETKRPTSQPDVWLGPFVIPPYNDFSEILAFVGDNPLQYQPTLLREDEIFQLIQEGFPLPNRKDTRTVFLEQCLKSPHLFAPMDLLQNLKLASQKPAQQESQPIPILKDSPLNLPMILPRRPHSATALENYSLCPSRYLFNHRLRLKSEIADPDNSHLIYGRAIHKTLETFFKAPHLDYDSLPALFDKALEEFTISAFLKLRLNIRSRNLWPRLKTMEAQLATFFTSKPTYFEYSFLCSIEGIQFQGVIDRIDQVSDGDWIVFDYKTGTVDFSPNQISNGFDFQVVLYLLAASEKFGPLKGFLFYDLKRGELRRGLMRSDRISLELKQSLTRGHALESDAFLALLEKGKAHLLTTARAIESGNFLPTPSQAACAHCQFTPHCRRAYGFNI